MAKKKETSDASASMDVELSSNQVLQRIMGYGAVEADIVLKPISAQDQSVICESYTRSDTARIIEIVSSYSTFVED